MSPTIKTITLKMPLKLGTVNCYLVETESGFVLIDTGAKNQRDVLEDELINAGCRPGNLRLIILTHGDFDHTGNAAYLAEKFGCKIAMHPEDSGMAEHGDMFWNRESSSLLVRAMKVLIPIFFGFGKSQRFTPDFAIENGHDFSAFGFEAQALSLPGHSKGSIGILTSGGDLFCGDLFENTGDPALNSIMDNLAAANASIDKLKNIPINTIYPGHGNPFTMTSFLKKYP